MAGRGAGFTLNAESSLTGTMTGMGLADGVGAGPTTSLRAAVVLLTLLGCSCQRKTKAYWLSWYGWCNL